LSHRWWGKENGQYVGKDKENEPCSATDTAAHTLAELKDAQIAVLQQQLVAQEREIQAFKHTAEASMRTLSERLNALEQQAQRAGAEPLAARSNVLGPLARALP
jgi:hypothetical protein